MGNRTLVIAEYRRLAAQHAEFGRQYAERSREFSIEVSDAYSAAAEVHYQLSKVFSKRADEFEPEEVES